RRDVRPDVHQVHAQAVHRPPVTTIISDLTATMPARFDRGSNLAEGLGLAFRVVEQAVMGRVESSWNGQAELDADRNPVSELHSQSVQVMPELNVPAGDIVDEEGAARLEDADAFTDPFLAPVQVFASLPKVVDAGAVFLPEIEGRI